VDNVKVDNVKVDLSEIELHGVAWIYMTQDIVGTSEGPL
jgi:hypothetical protein